MRFIRSILFIIPISSTSSPHDPNHVCPHFITSPQTTQVRSADMLLTTILPCPNNFHTPKSNTTANEARPVFRIHQDGTCGGLTPDRSVQPDNFICSYDTK